MYYINNVVDINNYLSIKSGYSMGTYDLAKTKGDILWMRAPEGTAYRGIGKDVLNIEFLPWFYLTRKDPSAIPPVIMTEP